MYNQICSFLQGRGQLTIDVDGEEPSRITTVAVAAVLWEMARIDGDFDPREFTEIIFGLDRSMNLMDGEAAGLLEIAKVLNANPQRLSELVDQIIRNYSDDQRTVIYTMVCRVAEADGVIQNSERRLENALAAKLGIVPLVSKI